MGLPEKLALVRFHYHGDMCSLGSILYQLGIKSREWADEFNKEHFFKAMEAFQSMSKRDQRKIQRKGSGL